jgi:hypothetical protein
MSVVVGVAIMIIHGLVLDRSVSIVGEGLERKHRSDRMLKKLKKMKNKATES